MPRIHWVTRQNKLETPKEKDEVRKREVHECDGKLCAGIYTSHIHCVAWEHLKIPHILLRFVKQKENQKLNLTHTVNRDDARSTVPERTPGFVTLGPYF